MWRIFMSGGKTHFETISVVTLNAAVGIFFIYWVGFHTKEDKDESLLRTVTKLDTGTAAAASSTHLQKKSPKKKESKNTNK